MGVGPARMRGFTCNEDSSMYRLQNGNTHYTCLE